MPPRMPHNNRMSTSASLKTHDIWKSTIGHDPYAASEETERDEKTKLNEEKAKTLLQIARSQNVEGRGNTSSGTSTMDDHTKKMFFGLKGGKKTRAEIEKEMLNIGDGRSKLSEDARRRLDEDSSSSEDEFIEEEAEESEDDVQGNDRKMTVGESQSKHKKDKKKRKKRSKSKKRRKYSSSSSSSSDDDSSHGKSKKRRRRDGDHHKQRKKHKERKRHK